MPGEPYEPTPEQVAQLVETITTMGRTLEAAFKLLAVRLGPVIEQLNKLAALAEDQEEDEPHLIWFWDERDESVMPVQRRFPNRRLAVEAAQKIIDPPPPWLSWIKVFRE